MRAFKHYAAVMLAAAVLAACQSGQGGSSSTSTASAPAVAANPQDYAAFVGTWTGTLGPGEDIRIEVDPDIAAGGEARYWYGGKGGAMGVEFQGDKIKLQGSKNSVLIGPVNGNKMPYVWNGSGGQTAKTTLTKQ